MPHDVFISHSSTDAATAQAVLAALEARGVRCWIAPRDITAGRAWEPSILDALASARAVVLVFSGAANASAHVRREVAAAADAGVPVVPFRVDRAEMDQALRYYLAGVHWLDAASGPLDRHLAALADTVETLLDREPAGAPAAGAGPAPATRKTGGKVLKTVALIAVLIALAAGGLFLWTLRGMGHALPEDAGPATAAAVAPPAAPPPLPPFEAEPDALVRRLYSQGSDAASALPALFTPDLVAAQAAAGLRGRRDWRYPGDDRPDFTELTFTTERTGDLTAATRVQWGSWPRSRDVTYTLCRRVDGRWRVTDVSQGGEYLRRTRGLPPPDPVGGC